MPTPLYLMNRFILRPSRFFRSFFLLTRCRVNRLNAPYRFPTLPSWQHLPAATSCSYTASSALDVWPSPKGLLCSWPDVLELATRQYSWSKFDSFCRALKTIFSVYCHTHQRTAVMRCINLRLTLIFSLTFNDFCKSDRHRRLCKGSVQFAVHE